MMAQHDKYFIVIYFLTTSDENQIKTLNQNLVFKSYHNATES